MSYKIFDLEAGYYHITNCYRPSCNLNDLRIYAKYQGFFWNTTTVRDATTSIKRLLEPTAIGPIQNVQPIDLIGTIISVWFHENGNVEWDIVGVDEQYRQNYLNVLMDDGLL